MRTAALNTEVFFEHRGVRVWRVQPSSYQESLAHQWTYTWSSEHNDPNVHWRSPYLFSLVEEPTKHGIFIVDYHAVRTGKESTAKRLIGGIIDAVIDSGTPEEERPWYGGRGQLSEDARICKAEYDRSGFVDLLRDLAQTSSPDELIEAFSVLSHGGYARLVEDGRFYTETAKS